MNGRFVWPSKAIRFFREVNPPGQGGKVINMSSVGGAAGLPGIGFYAASKFGMSPQIRRIHVMLNFNMFPDCITIC